MGFFFVEFFELDKPEVSLTYGQTNISKLNLLVIENDRLTIDCQIDSNPPLNKPITWLKNDVLITSLLIFYMKLQRFLISFFCR